MEYDPPDIVDDSITLIYSQYRNRYEPPGEPDPRLDNNLPEFLRSNLAGNAYGEYGPNDIVDKVYSHLIDAFHIDIAMGDDLDNIGYLIDQIRPARENLKYMTPNYANPPFNPAVSGTPWGGYPESSTNANITNAPWYFQNDPIDVDAPVSDAVYRRALHCASFKYFSDYIAGTRAYPNWNVASIPVMIYTIYILLKTPGRTAFEPSNITLTQDASDPLEWTIGFGTSLGTITEDDKALVNFTNPNGTKIWSRMAGLTVNITGFDE